MIRLFLCLTPFLLVSEASSCNNLEFDDLMLDKLVPCPYVKASGMLCMKDNVDVIVWPSADQSAQLEKCGIHLPRSAGSRKSRVRRSLAGGTELGLTAKRRQKRQHTFTSITSEQQRSTEYDFQGLLMDMMRNEWKLKKPQQIDPMAKLWIENNVTLSRDDESGIYRALVAPSSQFDPDDNSGKKVVDIVKRLLNKKKNREDWEWLDMDRISDELELCYNTDYSTVANEDVRFEAPIAAQREYEKRHPSKSASEPQSSLHFWYYKMSCLQRSGRIFLSLVIYTDRMEFEDLERTVDDWMRTPETMVKWVNETKQRIVATKKEKKWYNKATQTGKRCHRVKGGSVSGAKTHCEPYKDVKKVPKKLELWADKILTDVTPKKFEYEVNRWRKYSKILFVRRTITLEQREHLKNWIRNAMEANILRNFRQFF